ncbi:hypothetical protein BDV25DRAFT_166117 [Aspergillus avenaceus]|uniref:Uncharacterized protein n=1 Tax=Aspergillus avenaceus TaxID=36643 RepID=A0A5N6TEG1_ASPAV|nr:hypothetical protein BDV25DRAFT_166117 [Aspergillus avenaceus]
MARFIPTASKRLAVQPSKSIVEESLKRPWWQAYLLSDIYIPLTKNGRRKEDSPEMSRSSTHDHRQTASLNDADTAWTNPKWLGNLMSPASPVLPSYPPPVRAPTPPGLPSFGTEDAIRYTSQFTVDSAAQPQPSEHANEINKAGSYGQILRRFFRVPASVSRSNRRVDSVARAVDGTAVQGRFPYRQSAHGVSAGGRLDDHPFHRRTMPVAQCDSVNVSGDDDASASKSQSATRRHAIHSNRDVASTLPMERGLSLTPECVSASTSSMPPMYRCESHHASVSLQQRARTAVSTTMDPLPEAEPADNSTAITQSPQDVTLLQGDISIDGSPHSWLESSKIMASCFGCCLRARNEQDMAVYSNVSSNDTYTTARSQFSRESTPQKGRCNSIQEVGRWCSTIRASFQTFCASLSGSSTWLDQAREPF